jgi:predicted nucleic acid-binding protein
MSVYVVDASVAAKWYFPELWHKESRNYLSPDCFLVAPDFLKIEFANIVYKKERQHEIDPSRAELFMNHFLQRTTIEFVSTERLILRAQHIAREISHPIYDCLYLSLALLLDAVVVTADKKFYNSVFSSPYQSNIAWVETIPQNN